MVEESRELHNAFKSGTHEGTDRVAAFRVGSWWPTITVRPILSLLSTTRW